MLEIMKNHPIVPSAKLFRVELDNDIADFRSLLAEEAKIDEETAKQSSQGSRLIVALRECENSKMDTSKLGCLMV